MLIPSPVSPRANDMTEAQRRELGRYFKRHADSDTCYRDSLLLALVLAGDKPAAEITANDFAFPDHPWTPHRGLLDLCDLFDLSYRRIGRGTGNSWFIAPTEGRLDFLPTSEKTNRNEAWHRRLGVVLGYPYEAIEFFIDTNGEKRTLPRDLVENGTFSPEELAYTQFVFYIHDDSIEGFERAIETGKARRARFAELAKEWDLPALDRITENVFEESKKMVAPAPQ